jgi:hypothetical protein
MSSIDVGPRPRPLRPAALGPQLALGVLVALIVSVAVNAGVAWLVSEVDSGPGPVGLAFIEYAPLTLVGVLAGTAGWALVRRFAKRPRSVLRVLVPVVLLVSFVPDFLVLTVGATATNVAGLILMHISVAATTVAALNRALPLTPQAS